VPVELEGVPNLYRMTDNIYRSAQPTKEGFKNLEKLGVKTVLNLRGFHSDDLSGTGIEEVRVKMEAWDPDYDELVRALRILSDSSSGPFLIHCQHGADRTGMISAVYRMVFQDWSRDKAIDEMTRGGYGFHAVWVKIPRFLRKLDIDALKVSVNATKK
jgi:protein tyrosine/serine phosphatase